MVVVHDSILSGLGIEFSSHRARVGLNVSFSMELSHFLKLNNVGLDSFIKWYQKWCVGQDAEQNTVWFENYDMIASKTGGI